MIIVDNKVVSIDYTLTDDDGDIIDSSIGSEPLVYLHGAGYIIAGLEAALQDKSSGEKLSVRVAPVDGYGKRIEELVQVVSQDMFDGVDDISVGMQFHAENASGEMHVVTVLEVSDETITIDGNHALADKYLNFEVEIKAIRDATAKEIEHGHVHSDDGNCD